MFAKQYDLLMADVDYEALYLDIAPYLRPSDLILDAGCGSGYFLVELLKHNHHAIGVDIDNQMLSLAQQKLADAQLPIELYEHDLRQSLPIQVDVIVALFDVVNYFKGLKTVFRHFKKALKPNGTLIFDMYKETVLDDYQMYTESEQAPFAYEWQMDTKGNIINHQISIDRETYRIKQYVHPLENVITLLSELKLTFEIRSGLDSRKHYIIAKHQI